MPTVKELPVERLGSPPDYIEKHRKVTQTSGMVEQIESAPNIKIDSVPQREARCSLIKVRTETGEIEDFLFPRRFSVLETRLLKGSTVSLYMFDKYDDTVDGWFHDQHYRLVLEDTDNGWTVDVQINDDGKTKVTESPKAEKTDIHYILNLKSYETFNYPGI